MDSSLQLISKPVRMNLGKFADEEQCLKNSMPQFGSKTYKRQIKGLP